MKNLNKVIITLLMTIALSQITGCETNRSTETAIAENSTTVVELEQTNHEPISIPIIEIETPVIVPEDSFATIVSFGDTLCHKPLLMRSMTKKQAFMTFLQCLNM